MSNLTARARSNYFAVEDRAKFLDWVDGLDLSYVECSETGKFAIFCDDLWPSDRATEEEGDVDFFRGLASQLATGETAVLMETGAEGMRYLLGSAIAIHDGQVVNIGLDDIYELAKEKFALANEPTRAEY
jgi:hypothetical protein